VQLLNELVTGKISAADLDLMLPEEKAERIEDYASASEQEKADIISLIMTTYRTAASAQVKRLHPELQEMRDKIPPRSGSVYSPWYGQKQHPPVIQKQP
jgi:hypothetical protein